MNLKEEIKTVLSYESSKEEWRNEHSSDEFIHASKVGKLVGSPLNRSRNCGCIEDLFIVLHLMTKEKINLKQEQMTSKYILKKGAVLFSPATGVHLTSENITDKAAKELLKKYPARIASFESFPEDWNKAPKKKESKKDSKK